MVIPTETIAEPVPAVFELEMNGYTDWKIIIRLLGLAPAGYLTAPDNGA
jgi:hypothetical protein